MRARVTGVTFMPGYPGNLADLSRRAAVDGPLPCELRRDLDNAHDLNATGVWIEGRQVGWLPANLATEIAPELDVGYPFTVEAVFVAQDPDHRDRPGLEIEINL